MQASNHNHRLDLDVRNEDYLDPKRRRAIAFLAVLTGPGPFSCLLSGSRYTIMEGNLASRDVRMGQVVALQAPSSDFISFALLLDGMQSPTPSPVEAEELCAMQPT